MIDMKINNKKKNNGIKIIKITIKLVSVWLKIE
jgi:hypothetical protein